MTPLAAWAHAFLATEVIEVPIAAGWLRGRLPLGEAVVVAVLASALTHPVLWVLWPAEAPRLVAISVGETGVCAVEAAVYWWRLRGRTARPVRTAVFVSLLANASSSLAGIALMG